MLSIVLLVLVGMLSGVLVVTLNKLKSLRGNLDVLQDNLDHARHKLTEYEQQVEDSDYELSQLRVQVSGLRTTLDKYKKYQEICEIEQYVINRTLQAENFVEMTKVDASIMVDDIKGYIERVKAFVEDYQTKAIQKVDQQAREKLQRYYKQAEQEYRLQDVVSALEHKIHGYQQGFSLAARDVLTELIDGYQEQDAARQLQEIRQQIEQAAQNKKVAKCNYVDEDRRNTTIDMISLAFNSRADLYLSRLTIDNLGLMLQALQDDFHLINYKGQDLSQASIQQSYLDLRLQELKFAALLLELKKVPVLTEAI
ncbi:hypothetical protein BS636_08395 [Acinetobacter sp. LoGeW2-3]|uniref:DUF4041 domain-containing protein n=1 Tax=Acinetobacter sp. LoGeW2-3 TaxID=1808001 RepID=UPI000C058E40|nr:DUF4041 domain-containing protein [Acinetobacter sp. LoGeW2-3]ATO19670.1 hypothetical protein BS636_08395 [Acinetobacter sp. LoGeW2-3]